MTDRVQKIELRLESSLLQREVQKCPYRFMEMTVPC